MMNQHFNSIKVQLEHDDPDNRPVHVLYFNSIKVQLERLSFYRRSRIFRYFNSIKVQLERRSSALLLSSTEFQFHKGTIRTRGPSTDLDGFSISIP